MRNKSTVVPHISVSACSYRRALELIADKWTVLVIYALEDGKQRYGDLRRQIEGITKKMLTQTLRNLERDGLVLREVHPSLPPTVEYSLTPLGESMIEPLKVLHKWTSEHFQQVEQARAAFDQRAEEEALANRISG